MRKLVTNFAKDGSGTAPTNAPVAGAAYKWESLTNRDGTGTLPNVQVVPFADSEELVRDSGLPNETNAMFTNVEGEWDESRVGMIELDAGRPWSIGGLNALHSEWWLRRHWGRLFEVTKVVPYAQIEARFGHGLISLRKDGRPIPSVADLLRLDPDDPREAASLQFNIELLKERLAFFWERDAGSLRIENDHLQSENEHLQSELQVMKDSKSWRLTDPLRRLRSLTTPRR